jgi:hypothetical protein
LGDIFGVVPKFFYNVASVPRIPYKAAGYAENNKYLFSEKWFNTFEKPVKKRGGKTVFGMLGHIQQIPLPYNGIML